MKRGDRQRYADALGSCVHTLRRWEREAEEAAGPPPGRPPRSKSERSRARSLVHEVVKEQGWGAGEGPVHRALKGAVSRRLTRQTLADLKREHRGRRCQVQERERTSVRVHARDALWSQDATHLGRDEAKKSIQAEVIREVASTCTLEIRVGPAATADDVIDALEQARATRGTLPLVWATDNGSAYVSATLQKYLADNQVVPLLSLPRTPQHNAWAEHGMRELKEEAELAPGDDPDQLLGQLLQARNRLDHHRLRRSRSWMTAADFDAQLPEAESLVNRERFYADACCAIRDAVLNSASKRERRRATRAAVLQCMQEFQLITRTRGGVPLTSANSYRVS